MGTLNRAFLYIVRKRSRTFLLLAILLVVSTVTLDGLAILSASESSSMELRGSTGSSFTVERNVNTGEWVEGNTTDSYKGQYSTQEYITDKMLKSLSGIEGIIGYNAKSIGMSCLTDLGGNPYETIKTSSRFDGVGLNYMAYLLGIFQSEYDSFFLSNKFELTDGRHITKEDDKTAIISNDLANTLNLGLGDKFALDITQIISGGTVNNGGNTRVVEIVGLYDLLITQDDRDNLSSFDLYENYVYLDMATLKELSAWIPLKSEREGYAYADFYIADPQQLEFIIAEAQNLNTINWNNFIITANDEVYQRSASSMSNLAKLIITLIIAIITISTVIITFILSIWIKSRTYETGILLASGISKPTIVIQHMLEVGMLATISFTLSYFLSRIIAGNIGGILDSEIVIVTPENFILVCALGVIILTCAVTISSIPILRMKPREILTKMS